MRKIDPFAFLGAEPQDIGVLPISEAGKFTNLLYIWAQKNNFAAEIQILFEWVDQWIDTPKEEMILKHLFKLTQENNMQHLYALVDFAMLDINSLCPKPLVMVT